jgi:hypothetical protein
MLNKEKRTCMYHDAPSSLHNKMYVRDLCEHFPRAVESGGG